MTYRYIVFEAGTAGGKKKKMIRGWKDIISQSPGALMTSERELFLWSGKDKPPQMWEYKLDDAYRKYGMMRKGRRIQ